MLFEKQVLGIYKNLAYNRCDDTGKAYYFSPADFPGLQAGNIPFASSLGHTLQGWLYCYEGYEPTRLVVFDHGFFGGHRSYMREIEMLCRHGFQVFAYDHTGCMTSGGKDPNGMAQSLHDLDDCLTMLEGEARFAGLDISVVGHSWGGFSTMNIAALHPQISHVVVMSGFVSVERLVNCFFAGLLKPYRKAVMALERSANPKYVDFDGVKSLESTKAKVLLIYSDNDQLCRRDPHYDALKAGLAHKENVEFMLVSGKGHNPNSTADAVKYLAAYSAAQNKLSRKKQLETAEQKAAFVASFDWHRMTQQDEAVWQRIFACLDCVNG